MDQNKELKELLDFAISGVNAGILAHKDGKIGVEDLGLILSLIPKLEPAMSGLSALPAELSAMTPEGAADLVAFVSLKLTVEDEKAKKIIDASLKVILSAYELVKALK